MILVKTEVGNQAFKDRSIRLTPRQRSAFILFDGRRSVSEVLEAGMGIESEDIDGMVQLGLLGRPDPMVEASDAAVVAAPVPMQPAAQTVVKPAAPTAAPATTPAPARSSQQRYKDAYSIATQLTGSLGLRGFRLNLSVEGISTYEELLELAPKIRAAVGPEKAQALDRALGV
ncbi:MAG: hypothetical protein EOP82_05150 [Variovorax sp.]|nr:MAG: hypothetical protein EOP82_05150 [Variovorax sp.]